MSKEEYESNARIHNKDKEGTSWEIYRFIYLYLVDGTLQLKWWVTAIR
jgi:hypothetical protein